MQDLSRSERSNVEASQVTSMCTRREVKMGAMVLMIISEKEDEGEEAGPSDRLLLCTGEEAFWGAF